MLIMLTHWADRKKDNILNYVGLVYFFKSEEDKSKLCLDLFLLSFIF